MNADTRILELLGPDPSRDDFDELYALTSHDSIMRTLAPRALPKDGASVIRRQISRLSYGRFSSVYALSCLFELGVRWETSSLKEIAQVRRDILKISEDYPFIELMKLLARDDHCSPAILKELGRTSGMRERMHKVGFFPPAPDSARTLYQMRPTRSREVLTKFGIDLPKPAIHYRSLPKRVTIGPYYGKQVIQLDRAALFDLVWSEPVDKLAARWGLSGRGLAKACERLKIPVPPRGFWQKVQNGRRARKPPLPRLPAGQAEEIVIHT
jgi:hypothetical protein